MMSANRRAAPDKASSHLTVASWFRYETLNCIFELVVRQTLSSWRASNSNTRPCVCIAVADVEAARKHLLACGHEVVSTIPVGSRRNESVLKAIHGIPVMICQKCGYFDLRTKRDAAAGDRSERPRQRKIDAADIHHSPVKFGGRFSMKACVASWWSTE